MLRISCLVDNLPKGRVAWAEHGFSLLLETEGARILMDTGMSGTVLMHNAWRVLKIDLAPLDAVFLSHGHSDHTGGLATVLDTVPGVRVVAHPLVFLERLDKEGDGVTDIGCPLSMAEVAARARLTLSADRIEVARHIWSTGEIAHRPFELSGSPDHRVRMDGRLAPDPYTDDMGLVVETADGLVLVLGCCHAGLLNALEHVSHAFAEPIRAIVGGTHLAGSSDAKLDAIAHALESRFGAPQLHLSHCTSPEVVFRLQARLGNDRVKYLGAQSVIEL